jgi:hypothetical protein
MSPYLMDKMVQHTQHELARSTGKRNWMQLFRRG